MSTRQGIIRVQRHDQTITFRAEGWATLNQSLPFRQLALQCVGEGALLVRVDLRQCVYMDSTFIGDLLLVKRVVEQQAHGAFVLVSPSSECRCLLEQMKLDRIFPVSETVDLATEPWTDLPSQSQDVGSFKRNVVEAHQELASLPGPAGDPFRAVAHSLTQALEAEEGL